MGKKKLSRVELTNALIDVLGKAKPTIEDTTWVYGALGVSIGSSICGIDLEKENLSIDELLKRWENNPSVGVAMMAMGAKVMSWVDQFQDKQQPPIPEEKGK